MSINLGTKGLEAISELRTTEAWKVFTVALEEAARAKLHAALESPPELRYDATGYARGLHDLWVAVAAASMNVNARQVTKLSATAKELLGV